MPKIESYTPNPTQFFLLDGLRRERGSWGLFYENENETVIGEEKVGIVYKEDTKSFLVNSTRFSDYVNGSGTPFPDMGSLVTELNTLLNLSN